MIWIHGKITPIKQSHPDRAWTVTYFDHSGKCQRIRITCSWGRAKLSLFRVLDAEWDRVKEKDIGSYKMTYSEALRRYSTLASKNGGIVGRGYWHGLDTLIYIINRDDPLEIVTPRLLKRLEMIRLRIIQPETYERQVRNLREFFKWAQHMGYIHQNPFDNYSFNWGYGRA